MSRSTTASTDVSNVISGKLAPGPAGSHTALKPVEATGCCQPYVANAAWEAITSDPHSGVYIFGIDGVVRYANDQAAEMYHGAGARGETYVNASCRTSMPDAFVEEREAAAREALVHGKPVMMRFIWRGELFYAWIHHITPLAGAHTPMPEFMVITRRMTRSIEQLRANSHPDIAESESKYIGLGQLTALSKAELLVLAWVGEGLSAKEVAAKIFRSEHTVLSHIKSIHEKLGIHGRASLLQIAGMAGLRPEDIGKQVL